MIESRIRKNKDGEPVWTFKVTGYHDMFRLAFALGHCQVEFLAEGIKAFRYIRRRWSRAAFAEFDRRMTGGKVVEYGWGTRPRREP